MTSVEMADDGDLSSNIWFPDQQLQHRHGNICLTGHRSFLSHHLHPSWAGLQRLSVAGVQKPEGLQVSPCPPRSRVPGHAGLQTHQIRPSKTGPCVTLQAVQQREAPGSGSPEEAPVA